MYAFIRRKNRIIHEQYPVVEFKSKEELGQFVEKDFKELVSKIFPKRWISEIEKVRLEQRACLKRLTQVYVPQIALEDAIDNFVSSKEKALVITGESGMGKSALLANWIQKKEKEGTILKIIYHFVGMSKLKGNFRKIRQRLINEVRKIFGIIQNLEEKSETESVLDKELSIDEKKKNELQKLLFSTPQNENLVIILDGINNLTDMDDMKQLDWLPKYPENVKFIFSTPEDDPVMDVLKKMNYPVITMPALDIVSRKRLITDYLLQFGKKLLPAQTDRIANNGESANPMVLCALLDELRIFGVFEKLDAEIDRYLASQSITDFYTKVLERLEKIFDYSDTDASNLAKDILSLLYVSRDGLSETELVALTGAKPIYWSQVYNALGNNIMICGSLLNFSHSYIREAIKRRYFNDKKNENSYRLWIVHYLKTNRDIPEKRTNRELPYQLYHLEDSGGLYRFLKKQGISYWIEKDIHELAKYCRALNENDKKKMSIDIEKELELDTKDADKNELPEAYNLAGNLFYTLGFDNSLALKFIQQAMTIREEIQGNTHENTAESYHIMGLLHFEKGNYQKALEHYQQALNIRKKTLGNNHADTANSYNNIGLVYNSMGDYPQALMYLEQALCIQKIISGEKHIDTATKYNNIGLVYNSMGNKSKALENFQLALNIQEEVLGKNHNVTAISYNNVGMVYSGIGDYPKALMYVGQALNIQKELLGEKHINTALSYNNIGEINTLMGNYQNALEYFQWAYNIQIEILGEEHPNTVLVRNNLAGIYIKKGIDYFILNDNDLVINALTQAIKMIPAKGEIYAIRAAAYYQKGDTEAAMTDINKSIDLGCKDALGQAAKLILEKGNIHLKNNDFDQAITEYTMAVRLYPNYTTAYNIRGNAYYSKKDYNQAIADYSQAIRLNPNEAVYYSNRAGSYSCKGNYDRAIMDYSESIRLNPNNANTYSRRGNIYYFNRDYDRAIADYETVLKIDPNNANAMNAIEKIQKE